MNEIVSIIQLGIAVDIVWTLFQGKNSNYEMND